jgi:hypothetical protein
MTHSVRGFGLAATLALVSSFAVAPMAKSQSTAAYVYVQVQGPAGPVYGYRASSDGHLGPISGSPFKPGTAIVGGNGSQFFTLGHTLLHSWAVESNGAIGAQLSQAPILDYGGGSCGGTANGDNGAVLDNTGKYIYVMLQHGSSCAAYQSYAIGRNGDFTFLGDTEQSLPNNASDVDLPSILGDETFAYADWFGGPNSNRLGFRRASTGELQLIQFTETDPALDGSPSNYDPIFPAASPTGNYVVLSLLPYEAGPPQLGVYTVDSKGNLSTTNTSSTMPTGQGVYNAFSPDGAYVANFNGGGSGIEIYKFNGAAPLTFYKAVRDDGSTTINQVVWDNSSHMYGISLGRNELYMFTVTSTSVTEDAVVPLGMPVSLAVVSQAAGSGGGSCTAPSANGVNVCSPAEGSTLSSPVQISAAATVSGGVYRFELWSGGKKLLSSDNGTMNQTLPLAPGSYKLTFDAYNSSKTVHEYATRDITVQ